MSIGIGVGLLDFPFSSADAFWNWIGLCEDEGVDSLWQSDRLVSSQPTLECMSTMAAVAGATKRLKFGMNVASVALRDPLLLAKQCATIDMLSNGRLLPAFGIGSPFSSDWEGMGRSTQGRGRRTDEGLDIIARLWRGERVDHEGEFFCLHDAHISPLPVQKKLPLWIGGSSRAAIRRTARIGTGWLGGRETPDDVARVVRGVKAACEETGRRVPDDHYGAAFFYRFGRVDDASVRHHVEASRRRFPDRDPMASTVVGDGETIFGHVQEFVKAGASKFVLRPLGDNDEDLCEQTRILVREVFPAVDALNAAAKMSS